MIVLDASVWVSRFVEADAHHEATRSWLSQYVRNGNRVAVPTVALAEVAGAVARRTSDTSMGTQTAGSVEQLPDSVVYDVDLELVQHATTIAASLRLSGIDSLYVALASQLGVPLVTWDREQMVRSEAVIDVRSPSESLGPVSS